MCVHYGVLYLNHHPFFQTGLKLKLELLFSCSSQKSWARGGTWNAALGSGRKKPWSGLSSSWTALSLPRHRLSIHDSYFCTTNVVFNFYQIWNISWKQKLLKFRHLFKTSKKIMYFRSQYLLIGTQTNIVPKSLTAVQNFFSTAKQHVHHDKNNSSNERIYGKCYKIPDRQHGSEIQAQSRYKNVCKYPTMCLEDGVWQNTQKPVLPFNQWNY